MNLERFINISKTIVCLTIFSYLQTAYIANSFAVSDKNTLSAMKYLEEGKYHEAITKYYEIIEKFPKNMDAYYNLAVILEIVLADYESAMLLYDKALSIAENKMAFFSPEQEGRSQKELNSIISKIKDRKDDLTDEIFNSIDGIVFPRYIVLKSGKSTSLKSLTDTGNEYRFINIRNDRYYVVVPSGDEAWIKGNDIRLIYQNSNETIELTNAEKAERYKRFANSFPLHKLANTARNKMNAMISKQTSTQKTVTIQQSTKPSVQAKHGEDMNSAKKKNAQEQLNEIEERYKKGAISDEERKRLRMEVLKNL